MEDTSPPSAPARRRPAGRAGMLVAVIAGALALVLLVQGTGLAAVLGDGPVQGGPAAAAAARPLPACRYGDVLTAWRRLPQFRVTIMDTWFRVSASYRPPLRSASGAGVGGGYLVRSDIITDLRALHWAANRAGAPLAIRSAYRSYAQQAATFAAWACHTTSVHAVSFREGEWPCATQPWPSRYTC